MKKFIILIIFTFFCSNMSIASCSITGGACSINDLKKNNSKKEFSVEKKDKKQSTSKKQNDNHKNKLKNKKQGGKINHRLIKTKLI